MNDDIKIAKDFTVGDWKKLRDSLFQNNNKDNWEKAFDVFNSRIESRFLNPINQIKLIDKNNGEGFSIAIISIVLLEFIAAFEIGKIYEHEAKGPQEYSSSAGLLKDFIRKSNIFNSRIDLSHVNNFYTNIRCGLVHEARTKKSDVIISNRSIKNSNKKLFYFKDKGEYRLNRDLLLETIIEHIKEYRIKIIEPGNEEYRKSFLMKIDEIAGLEYVWYFIYGSNLNNAQLNDRLKSLNDIHIMKIQCTLNNYVFKYNKKSIDGSAKANIENKDGEKTEGIAILILKSTLDKFHTEFEKGYDRKEVSVIYKESIDTKDDSKNLYAITFISQSITEAAPSNNYISTVIKGAKENGLSEKYIKEKLCLK